MDKKEETVIKMESLAKGLAFLDRRIKTCHLWAKDKVAEKESLQKQKELFLQIAQDLTLHDLKVVYYARGLSKKWSVYSALRRLYRAECAWKNTTYQTDEYQDPF